MTKSSLCGLTLPPSEMRETSIGESQSMKILPFPTCTSPLLPLPNLQKMDLSVSKYLKELPDLSNAEKLEMLKVNSCFSLVELPPSIANLQKLERLDMGYCVKLQVVPTLLNLASLRYVWMLGCRQLRNIPDIARNITELTIADTMLEEMPDSIRFCRLKDFSIYGSIYDGPDIEKIPDWIKDLHQLEDLYIFDCPKLASLPELPASLRQLTVQNCESLETLIPFPVDPSIFELNFPNCFKLGREARRVITQQPLMACLPGRTIPAEFNQRALGNSLTIRSDLFEFKICAVVSPKQLMDECSLSCNIRINGCPIEKNIDHDISKIETEHLYMSYVFFSDEDDGWLEQDNEIVFEFEFSTPSHKPDIIQCGVQTSTDLDRRNHKQL